MLNKDLKLNEKIFETDVERKAIRDGFGQALLELGENNPNVVVLTADLTQSTKVDAFAQKFPARFFEVGVAEQNMVGIAAGLAVSGKIPFATSFSVFSPGKNWETVRTTIAYNNVPVKIAGHHSGIVTGEDGATHQATEDIALTRVLPNFEIYSPCDAIEAKKATLLAEKVNKPIFLRFSRPKTPVITTADTPFDKNINIFWTAGNPICTLFATGHLLYYALLAAKKLGEENIDVLVANIAVIKPLDEKTIIELSQKTKAVVTIEDHQIIGGMGSAVSEVLAKNNPISIEFIGLKDTFGESGEAEELVQKYELDDLAIIRAVKKVIGRK